MNKKVLTTSGILIAVLILFYFAVNGKIEFSTSATTTPKAADENKFLGIGQIEARLPDLTMPLSNSPKDIAWSLFQKYLSYNQDGNLQGVKNAVYKISPVCADEKPSGECLNRMSAAFSYGKEFKKDDFSQVWSDEKQIILSTDFNITETESDMSRTRAMIFFVKDGNGDWKMLSFSPFKGATVKKGAASSEELNDRLGVYTEDNDNDGAADYAEQCISATEKQICEKTDPNIRDTDGNGWWDGVDALLNQY